VRLRDKQNDESHDRRRDQDQKKRQMPPHGRHWLMRIDCELNVDVDLAGFVLYTVLLAEHDCRP
jgi:hypothetical protein